MLRKSKLVKGKLTPKQIQELVLAGGGVARLPVHVEVFTSFGIQFGTFDKLKCGMDRVG